MSCFVLWIKAFALRDSIEYSEMSISDYEYFLKWVKNEYSEGLGQIYSIIINTIKSDVLLGTDQQKKKNLSSFSQPHLVSKLSFFFMEHKMFMLLFCISRVVKVQKWQTP